MTLRDRSWGSPGHPLMHRTLLSPRVLHPQMPGTSHSQLMLRKAEVSKATTGRAGHAVLGLGPTLVVDLGTESLNTTEAALEGRT